MNCFLNRCRVEIVSQMLLSVKKMASKTHIRSNVGLNCIQINEYLDYVLNRRLMKLVEYDEKAFYKITKKGIMFLNYYADLETLGL